MITDFLGSQLKISRAKKHRDELYSVWLETFGIESNCPGLGLQRDANTGEHFFYVCRMPDIADFFNHASLIAGDAIHNLRSALDHLTYQLALWNTSGHIQKPEALQFPITDCQNLFRDECHRRLNEIHIYHRTLIERMQPYRGEDWDYLAILRDISNFDKHQLLIPVMIPSSDIQGFLTWSLGARLSLSGIPVSRITVPLSGPLNLGTEIIRFIADLPNPKYGMEVTRLKLPQIAFVQRSDEDAIDVIDRITAKVSDVIDVLDPIPEFARSRFHLVAPAGSKKGRKRRKKGLLPSKG